MIRDILTVLWKEWHDRPFSRRAGAKGGLISQLIFFTVLGVLLPLQIGPSYLVSPFAVIAPIWAPLAMISALIADSIAGERERHTLETLLASRLSDRAILFGKIGFSVCYSWAITVVIMLLALITVNVGHSHGKLLMYSAMTGLGTPVLALMIILFMCGLGTIVSLKAATVKQATQTLSIGFVMIAVIPAIAPILPQEWLSAAFQWFRHMGPNKTFAVFTLLFAVADIVVLKTALSRFQRSKLIL